MRFAQPGAVSMCRSAASANPVPRVEVHIVASAEAPSGIGEPGVPPIAPAVENARVRLTGRPTRRLPFRRAARATGTEPG